MAIDSLASVAHAAGFAMVPEEDVLAGQSKTIVEQTSATADGSDRWQAATFAVRGGAEGTRSSSIFDWVPNFTWRADGR